MLAILRVNVKSSNVRSFNYPLFLRLVTGNGSDMLSNGGSRWSKMGLLC